MLNQGYFYFQTTRSLIAAFGQIFNDIVVNRYSDNGNRGTVLNTIKVPISYAPIDKILVQLQQKQEPQQLTKETGLPTKTRTKISLPRLSYQITNYQYDSERKLNTLGQTISPNTNNIGTYLMQLNPVPYDISFEVAIMVKNNADGLQIIEQILPSFAPSYTINLSVIPEMGLERDVPVILANITQDDRFEGVPEENRILIWRLNFVCKAMIYPVIKDAGLIKKINAYIYGDQALTDLTATVNVHVSQDSNGNDILDSDGNPIIITDIDEVGA